MRYEIVDVLADGRIVSPRLNETRGPSLNSLCAYCQDKVTCWKSAAVQASMSCISRRQCPISAGSPRSGMLTA
jgi:hypothetical protein